MDKPDAVQSSSYVVLGVKERVGYGFGDFASNLSFGFISLFLLFFYTDIYGLTATEASMVFVISRIIDAGFNILTGYFVDKTNTRFGKLRPYLLFGAVPLGILAVLCFYGYDTNHKFYYALISYTVYCLAYTTVNTPYSALTNMITQHEGSRASLSVYRFAFAMLAYLVVSTQAERLIGLFTEPKEGYVFAACVFSGLATLFFLACFKMTKERVTLADDAVPPTIGQMAKAIYTNGPLVNLSMFTIFFYIVYILWMAIAIYFIKYVMKDEPFTPTFFSIQTAAYIAGTVICEKLIPLFGKKGLTLLALVVGALALGIQYFLVDRGHVAIMLCIVVFNLALAAGFVTMWSMIADTVEYAEWKTEVRTEGAIYGFFNFVTKIAMAIGGGLSGLVLQHWGYSAENITDTAVHGINIGMTVIPAVMMLLGFVFVLFYKLDEKTYVDIVKQIAARKETTQAQKPA